MSISERIFGKNREGEDIRIFTLQNYKGMKVEIMELGAAIVSMEVPNKMGKIADVVLGYDSVEAYEKQSFYMGAIVGRCANRIYKGELKLPVGTYALTKNEGENHLHGGVTGLDKKKWNGEIKALNGIEWLEMTCMEKDGEEGYPGNLEVSISYYLTDMNALEIEYFAVSDKDTAVNLTSHPYFNLKGHGQGDILDHELQIFGEYFTELKEGGIPTGKLLSVEKTPMDFMEKRKIGDGLKMSHPQLALGKGYDHNWALTENNGSLRKCAVLSEETSGRILEMQTTLPGLQLYTGNYLHGEPIGKSGASYGERSGLCLEGQYFPDSVHHDSFPSIFLQAFEKYRHKTVYRFR